MRGTFYSAIKSARTAVVKTPFKAVLRVASALTVVPLGFCAGRK